MNIISEKWPKYAIFIEFRIIQILSRVNLGCLILQGCFDESRNFLLTSDTGLSGRFIHQIYPPDVWRASGGQVRGHFLDGITGLSCQSCQEDTGF